MNPIRSCIACRRKNIKRNLVRIVKMNNGDFSVDSKQNQNFRAMYICRDINCLNKCLILLEKNKIKNIDNKSSMEKIINSLKKELEV